MIGEKLRNSKRHRQAGVEKWIKQLLVIFYLSILFIQFTHQTLLTNIYGKKLSEIKGDLSHRFLLLPSPYSKNRSPLSQKSEPTDLTHDATTDQYGRLSTLKNEFISHQQDVMSDYPNIEARRFSRSPGNNSNTLNNPPVGAAAWKQPQQRQQLDQSSNNALNQQRRSMRLQAHNGSTNEISQQARLLSSEPQVAEGVSTEFPNPNINNLGHEITKILRKFFLHGYDKRVRPNYSGPPALVNVSFHIIGISSVDEVQMDFTTDFYFRQKWFDPRLEFDPVGEIDELCVGAEFAEKIWLPDTFFANEKTATFHKATTENTFIRIGNNGRVYRSIRLTVTCSCPMDLQYFPMDRQRCKIEIESYGYNTRDIDYRWERGDASVSLNTKIELPQFKILGFRMGQEIQNLSSGDYIRLYCEIHFVRSMGYYLFQIYIPASLIVMISWVSFWLHRNATPARVALGVTTVLTMTTLMSSTNAALPKISYIKSIDVFLGTCFVMVFAALLEYASVGYIGKRIAMKRKRLQDLQQMQQHHQKVCVAAAASAAAAAAATSAQEAHKFAEANGGSSSREKLGVDSLVSQASQTLGRRANTATSLGARFLSNRSKTIQRGRGLTNEPSGAHLLSLEEAEDQGYGASYKQDTNGGNIVNNPTDRKASSGTFREQPQTPTRRRLINPLCPSINQQVKAQQHLTNNSSRTPLLAAGAAIAAAATSQHGHGPTTEFEVNQTHDMIRICGLTPSSIDKYSRVVFPVCFVCFNLMYWIIYGHISQQIEDKEVPLIPFIKG